MIEHKPKELRQAFKMAVKAGASKVAVMGTLGIAQATYYKWKGRLRESGDQWVNGEPIVRTIFSGETIESTHERIVELSLLYPKMGPEKLVWKLMEYGFPMMSSSTIHNILSKKSTGNRDQRAAELHRRFLTGLSLTPQQERVVEQIDPLVRWKDEKGRCAGEILTQDIIHLHHSSPLRAAAISIVVDTFDGAAFACFPNGRSESGIAVACAHEAIKDRTERGCIVQYMYTDKGYEFGRKERNHCYNEFLKSHGVVHRFVAQADNRRNPYASVVWVELRKFLFDGGVPNLASYRGRVHQLNPVIQEFLNMKFGRSSPNS